MPRAGFVSVHCLVVAWALAGGTGCFGFPGGGGTSETRGTIYLPGGRSLSVEIADTPEKQARGYMFRDSVGEGEGMIFLMGDFDIHPFWMRNCRVPLDIIWIDEDWEVVQVALSVPPCRDDAPCPSVVPMQKSLYVLEVAGGTSAALGLELGTPLSYGPPPHQAR